MVVTGGTKGIGRAIVERYAALGAWVYATYASDTQAAEAMLADMPSDVATRVQLQRCYSADTDGLSRMMQTIATRHNRLDILVNNAGQNADSLFLNMEPEQWVSVIRSNLTGTLQTTLAALSLMRAMTEGNRYIINLSSISGLYGKAGQTNYACTKGGIIGFTKWLARHYTHEGIQSICVVPGLINTAMASGMNPAIREAIAAATFVKRLGEPADVANTILYLTSGQTTYMAGSCISIDGGFFK